MSIDPSQPSRAITHVGRTFTIVVEQVASTEAIGPRLFSFWRVDTPGHAPYLGPRVTGNEDQQFFKQLVTTALWVMNQRRL